MRLQISLLIERAQTGEDGNCFTCSFYDALYYIVETLKLNQWTLLVLYTLLLHTKLRQDETSENQLIS
jgi:hypothetical protein